MNENMKPGKWWRTRGIENMLIIADADEQLAAYGSTAPFPIVATDRNGRHFGFRRDGLYYMQHDSERLESTVDLVEYLQDCTGFDDGVAEALAAEAAAAEETDSTETHEVKS